MAPRQTKKESKKGKFDPNYFTWPHPLAMAVISFGFYTLGLATFAPDSAPNFLGPIASFITFMGKSHHNICIWMISIEFESVKPYISSLVGFSFFTLYEMVGIPGSVVAVLVHSLEAAYAGKVCFDRRMTFSATAKWVLATFVFGFPSLTLRLLPYKPDNKLI